MNKIVWKNYEEAGITLLSLILTVVIMIILAGVTINVTLGEGGLINQAKHAAEQTANSTKAEQEQLDDLVSQLNDILSGSGGIGENVTNSTSGEDTNTVDTNTIAPEPEPEPLPDGTITIGEPQWQEDGIADVPITSSESGYIIQYQINGTKEGSWLTVQNGTVPGVKHGDMVYARLTDGEQYSEIQNKRIEDSISPTVTVTAQGSPTTNSITVTAEANDNETGMVASPTYTFQIKQSGQGSYTTPSGASNVSNATYTFTGLTQGTTYDIQVIVNGDNAGNSGTGLVQATTTTVPGADEGLATGSITASPVTWSGGKASTTLTTNEPGFQIQYQVNGTSEGSWSTATNSPVTVSNLNHNDTVYARLTDGTNPGSYAAINILDGMAPTVSVAVDEVTDTTIAVTVSATDNESGLADTGTYKYYLNDEQMPRETSISNTYIYTGLTAETPYNIKVEVVDKANNPGTGTASATTEAPPPISDTETQVANYADVDGNGTVDGVIYADLAIGGSGTGLGQSYTIPTSSGFKKYQVTQESYSGSFGTGQVIAPVSSSSGNERFYVMALSDAVSGTYPFWSRSGTNVVTSTEFGTGERNTTAMMSKTGSSSYLWGQITSQVNEGWYVPSKGEWAAFAEKLGVNGDNYSSKGLSSRCWSSSQDYTDRAWHIYFTNNTFVRYYVWDSYSVRLGTTF